MFYADLGELIKDMELGEIHSYFQIAILVHYMAHLQ